MQVHGRQTKIASPNSVFLTRYSVARAVGQGEEADAALAKVITEVVDPASSTFGMADQYQRVKSLFEQTLAREPMDRAAFLADACASDAALRAEVERLLAAHDEAGSFLETPARVQDSTTAGPADLTRTSAVERLAPGTRLGPYEVVALLGAGGMGEVYRGRDPRLHREVAIKVLPSAVATDRDRLHRFDQEARAAAALNHPNILAVYDVGMQEGAPYVVAELLDGRTLRARLAGAAPSLPAEARRQRPLPVPEALDYARQIARGLAAAHAKGIVHRDLKPENLFITEDGRVKILDFGLAKLTGPANAAAATATGTVSGVLMGTVGYMAPEQVRGEPADARSDIFSFGAILYEMVAGRRAFEGGSSAETLSTILRDQPPAASVLNPAVTPALDLVVSRCLEKVVKHRFASADEVALALESSAELAGGRAALPVRTSTSFRGGLLGLGAAGLVILMAFGVGNLKWRAVFGGSDRGKIESIAVLPLANLSADSDQEYFADGMTEALIADLAKVSALRVISRTSALRYRGTTKSVPEIARELHVDAIVEGSVQRSADRIRITAQLIHGSSDRHLWAEHYEGNARDVLSLQSNVARAISEEIKGKLTPQEQSRLSKPRPISPEAHEFYLKGRYHWNKRTPEDLQKAITYFNRATDIEPTFALAYLGLADCYNIQSYYSGSRPRDSFPRGKAAAARALELDKSLGEAHASLGLVATFYDWDWAAAEREFKRAIELNPGYATAHHWYAYYLEAMGRQPEAIAQITRAQELDPLSPVITADVAYRYLNAGQYDQAIDHARKTLELDASFPSAHSALGYVYLQKGDFSNSIAAFRTAAVSDRSDRRLADLGYALGKTGDAAEARKVLDELMRRSRERYVSPYYMALIYLGLGNKEEGFRWLERAYEERAVWFFALRVWPPLAPDIRSDRRFQGFLQRLQLPQQRPTENE